MFHYNDDLSQLRWDCLMPHRDQLHFCSAGLPRTAAKQLVCSMWHLGIAMQCKLTNNIY